MNAMDSTRAFSPVQRGALGLLSASVLDNLKKAAGASSSSTSFRIVSRVTLGLKLLHAEVLATKHWPARSSPALPTAMKEGNLEVQADSDVVVSKRYKIVQQIGQGTFSDVFLAEDLYIANTKVAIKVFRPGFELLGYREKVFLEQHLACLSHRGPSYVVQSVGFTNLGPYFCCVMKFYPSTLLPLISKAEAEEEQEKVKEEPSSPLGHLIKPKGTRTLFAGKEKGEVDLPPPVPAPVPDAGLSLRDLHNLRKISLHLILALSVLHKQNIIHGDVKPENCFLSYSLPLSSSLSSLSSLPDDFIVLLGDFSNSLHVSEVSDYYLSFDLQSLPYRAPEVLLGLPFSPLIDLWSLGLVLLELVLGRVLFNVGSREEMVQSIERRLGPLSRTRFSGGRYSDLLFTGGQGGKSYTRPAGSEKSYSDRVEQRKNVLELGDFIGGLLEIDPDQRMSSAEALQHSFLTPLLPIPHSLFLPRREKGRGQGGGRSFGGSERGGLHSPFRSSPTKEPSEIGVKRKAIE